MPKSLVEYIPRIEKRDNLDQKFECLRNAGKRNLLKDKINLYFNSLKCNLLLYKLSEKIIF